MSCSELQALNQEKMAHVEVLRQIHADINNLEGIIKQAKDSRSAAQVEQITASHLVLSPPGGGDPSAVNGGAHTIMRCWNFNAGPQNRLVFSSRRLLIKFTQHFPTQN